MTGNRGVGAVADLEWTRKRIHVGVQDERAMRHHTYTGASAAIQVIEALWRGRRSCQRIRGVTAMREKRREAPLGALRSTRGSGRSPRRER